MGIATDTELDAQSSQDDSGTTVAVDRLESPSLRVVAAVAAATGDDPATMPPLYDVVDPDALDKLLAADATVEIVFEYCGHAVEIAGNGDVIVDGQAHSGGDLQ